MPCASWKTYFQFRQSSELSPIYAPCDGTIKEIRYEDLGT